MNQQQSRQEEPRREVEASIVGQQTSAHQALEALVRKSVMAALGVPAGLQRVQVRQLWGGYYRVNVFVGVDVISATVAHSYFVEADGNGKILDSMPAVTRLY